MSSQRLIHSTPGRFELTSEVHTSSGHLDQNRRQDLQGARVLPTGQLPKRVGMSDILTSL